MPGSYISTLSLQQIIQTHFPGSILRRSWPLTGGISAQMTALELSQPDGRMERVVLRHFNDGRHLKKEYAVLKMTHKAGLPVPRPNAHDDSGQTWPTPYLLMTYMPGKMNFTPADLTYHMQQMAGCLAQIHQLNQVDDAHEFIPPAAAECPDGQPLQNNKDARDFTRMLRDMDQPPRTKHAAVLLHGDFWPGNLLWHEGHLTAVIDWEDAQWGDPLIDFAQTRSEIAWIFGSEALSTFSAHYQALQDLDYHALPYWDRCALLRQLRLIGGDYQAFADYFAGYGRPDITAESIRHDLLEFGRKI